MTPNDLYDLETNLVNELSTTVVKLAQKRGLGSEIRCTGAGGDKTKTVDEIAENAAKNLLTKFQKTIPHSKIV